MAKKSFMAGMPALALVFGVMIVGCVSTIPVTSNLNDFVMMSIKTNGSTSVVYDFSSKITDGVIKPYKKDKEAEISGSGYNISEVAALRRMVNEYLGSKFPSVSSDAAIKISVSLDDFWIEQYSSDSGGNQAVVAMFGGEINYIVVAKLKVVVTINKNGNTTTKVITASSEDTYVQGVGTGTATSNYARGKDSLENTHVRNINNANNKVIMLLNSYLDEQKL